MEKREGVVRVYQHHNNRLASLAEVSSSTDFVARNDEFLQFVDNLLLHIASSNPQSVSELMEQEWLLDENLTVQEVVDNQRKKFGEDIHVVSYIRWTLDPEEQETEEK